MKIENKFEMLSKSELESILLIMLEMKDKKRVVSNVVKYLINKEFDKSIGVITHN